MGTAYFESLLSYTDLKAKSTHCEQVGTRELAFYRLVAMAGFYVMTYLCHPAKIRRSWVNVRTGHADSVFESRLAAILQCHRTSATVV